ncbi:MAG: type II secretion system F family protein [Fusobacterium sp.]|nr:type II secretion system F family protein [Fusobacterium sp.]
MTKKYFQYEYPKLSLNTKLLFFEQLSTYMSSSIPLTTTLMNIKTYCGDKKIQIICRLLLKELDSGQNFSDSILKFKKVLGGAYCELLSLGAQSGELPQIINDIQDTLKQQRTIIFTIIKQVAYPAFLFFVIFIPAVIALFFFVIPRLANSFEMMLGTTPAHLKTLQNISSLLFQNIIPILIFLALVIYTTTIGIKLLIKSELLLKLPVIGQLVKYYNIGLFTKLLAISYTAGIPITEGILISSEALPNKIIKQQLIKCSPLVTRIPFTNAIAQTRLFDPAMISKIQAGELTGDLEKPLIEISKDINEALSTTISTLLKLIEPVLTIIMAILICIYGATTMGIV